MNTMLQNIPRKQFSSLPKRVRNTVVNVNAYAPSQVAWQKAKVLEVRTLAPETVELRLSTGKVAEGYSQAGQFLKIKVGDSKPSFVPLANAPTGKCTLCPIEPDEVDLLVKSIAGTTSEELVKLTEGSLVDISPIMGHGFKLNRIAPEKTPYMFLFANNTGISPIKALIESQALKASERKLVKLYYGGDSKDTMAYLDLLEDWKELGLEVKLVHSSPSGPAMQEAFEEDFKELPDASGTAAAIAGGWEMCQAIKECMIGYGVEENRILTNY